jgi:ABC-type bacteriocin/lantibiotic exporter with double-glycine peptidase domain
MGVPDRSQNWYRSIRRIDTPAESTSPKSSLQNCGRLTTLGASLGFHDVFWATRGAGEPIPSRMSLSLDPGRFQVVVGPNGAGKTTLLRLLYRFQCPATGSVSVDDEDIGKLPA